MNPAITESTVSPGVASKDRLTLVAVWLLCFSIPWDDMILLPFEAQFARVFTILVAIVWVVALVGSSPISSNLRFFTPAASFINV